MCIDRKNRTVLITGGTSGLGLELVKQFLEQGFMVIATGRQVVNIYENGDKFKLFIVDFNSLEEVARVAEKICETFDVGYIINNAGILSPPTYRLSGDNIEYTMQVNFLSHLLLNDIVLKQSSCKTRTVIASVISPVYRMGIDLFHKEISAENYGPLLAYARSKFSMVVMSETMQMRYQDLNLSCISFNPGTFRSEIDRMQKKWFRLLYHVASPFMNNPKKVAKVLFEVMTSEDSSGGVVFNSRKRKRKIILPDSAMMMSFIETSGNLVDSFKQKGGVVSRELTVN